MAPASSTLVHDAPPSTRPSKTDSPMTKKRSNAAASLPGDVELHARRENTLAELNEAVPQLPVHFFLGKMRGILPPLPTKDAKYLEKVIDKLKEGEFLCLPPKSCKDDKALKKTKKSAGDGTPLLRWKWFLGDPSASFDDENSVFKGIEGIARAVMTCSGQRSRQKPTVEFKCNPDRQPTSFTRTNKTRPDCYALLNFSEGRGMASANKNGKPHWINIAVPGEFKKDRADSVQNWTQILWSMNYIMQEDPRRRFVFAFTIEDTIMRIWFASRSDVLVSLPFDFNKRYNYMVEFFLRVIYAEEDQLGWDTTMERIPREGKLSGPFQYRIKCGDTVYETMRIISDLGAEAMRGRGTRVWEVRELKEDGDDDGKTLVLKDAWVDAGRMREHEILEKVREHAAEQGLLEGFERHFMHIRAASDVYIGEEAKLDHTHRLILRERTRHNKRGKGPLKVAKPSKEKRARLKSERKGAAAQDGPQNGPHGVDKRPLDPVERILQYEPKVHYRIVFEELGCTITQVDTLSGAFSALSDAVKGLQILHSCGWVHRDISTGNILVVDGVGKLSDLEYAKHVEDIQIHGLRTGTPHYMSIEVEIQKYVVTPRGYRKRRDLEDTDSTSQQDSDEVEDDGDVDGDADGELATVPPTTDYASSSGGDSDDNDSDTESLPPTSLELRSTLHDPSIPTPPPPPYDAEDFRHNPLHDLESAMWVDTWLLVCSEFRKSGPKMSDKRWAAHLENHKHAASKLFGDYAHRTQSIISGTQYIDTFIGVLPQIHDIADNLDVFREKLHDQYMAAFKDRHHLGEQPPFSTMAGDLHKDMIEMLDDAACKLQKTGKDLKIDVPSRDKEDDEDENQDTVAPAVVPTVPPPQVEPQMPPPQVEPQMPTQSSSSKRTSETARAEPVQRKRQRANDGKAVSLPVETFRATRSQTQRPIAPIPGPSHMTRSRAKQVADEV